FAGGLPRLCCCAIADETARQMAIKTRPAVRADDIFISPRKDTTAAIIARRPFNLTWNMFGVWKPRIFTDATDGRRLSVKISGFCCSSGACSDFKSRSCGRECGIARPQRYAARRFALFPPDRRLSG